MTRTPRCSYSGRLSKDREIKRKKRDLQICRPDSDSLRRTRDIGTNDQGTNDQMKCFRTWAKEKGLKPSPTAYLAKTSGHKRELRFSVSGNPQIEQSYRTHYISPILSEIKQKKLQEKLDKAPELVVFRIVQDSQCSQCKKELHKGSFLFMEAGQPLCLCCANLSELEFLPRGNAKLTRRVKKDSMKSTVVVEFSRSRKRYERQGILVDKESLRKARQELQIDDDDDSLF